MSARQLQTILQYFLFRLAYKLISAYDGTPIPHLVWRCIEFIKKLFASLFPADNNTCKAERKILTFEAEKISHCIIPNAKSCRTYFNSVRLSFTDTASWVFSQTRSLCINVQQWQLTTSFAQNNRLLQMPASLITLDDGVISACSLLRV